MTDLLCVLLSLLVLATAAIVHPTRARCPAGWWLDMGVAPSGAFACHRVPVGRDVMERCRLIDHSVQPAGELRGRVYCTGGMRPIVISDVAVACQPGGWR